MKAISKGTYNLTSFFVPTLGEIENYNKRKNALLSYWNTLWSFTLTKTEKETFITIENNIETYIKMAAEVAPTGTINNLWIKESNFLPLTTVEEERWEAILDAKGLDADSISHTLFSTSSKDIERKLQDAKRQFYAEFEDVPIYVTQTIYTKTETPA